MSTDEDLFEVMGEEAASLDSIPSEQDSVRLRKMGIGLVKLDREIADLEASLTEKKIERWEVQTEKMPDLMKEIGQDLIGLPSENVNLVLEAYCKANISKDWEDEKKDRAYEYLTEVGGGDLIKTVVVMEFGRTELNLARATIALLKVVAGHLEDAGIQPEEIPTPTVKMGVPWNSLTAFVREQVEKGEKIDLDILGAKIGSIVKIKKRKDK